MGIVFLILRLVCFLDCDGRCGATCHLYAASSSRSAFGVRNRVTCTGAPNGSTCTVTQTRAPADCGRDYNADIEQSDFGGRRRLIAPGVEA